MSAGLIGAVRSGLPEHLPARLGVAVSGGSDSTALLYLLAEICAETETQVLAVTVDHRLRPEATAEAAGVGACCAVLGISHETLTWNGWDGQGNMQNAARRARYSLIAEWAATAGIPSVALGHTLNDQAETVLMRLARGAGPDGLSGMPVLREAHGINWLRPLLTSRRDDLRQYLKDRGISWAEDPSNADLRYDRIRARRALELLAPLGIEPQVLARVACNMRSARDALDHHLVEKARDLARVEAGALCVDRPGFQALPAETARRLLSGAVRWINGNDYAPRSAALAAFARALSRDGSATLAGCHARVKGDKLWIFREYDAVSAFEVPPDELWDNRWRLTGTVPPPGAVLRALGDDGLRYCPDWRETGLPRDLLRATPALWQGDTLISAPPAGLPGGCELRLNAPGDAFFAALLSH